MPTNKKQTLYDALRQRVLTLDLAPGIALDETFRCDEFGMSRTPLREILQRLAGHGYLEITTNRGAAVSSMNLVVMRNFFPDHLNDLCLYLTVGCGKCHCQPSHRAQSGTTQFPDRREMQKNHRHGDE